MILAITAFGLVWTLPQLVLHSHGMEGHYRVPAVIGWFVSASLGMHLLWRQRRWILWGGTSVLFTILLALNLGPTVARFSYYTADSLALNQMTDYLVQHVNKHQAIVISLNPITHQESAFSLQSHLNFVGLNSPIYLLPVYQTEHQQNHPLVEQLITNAGFAEFADLEKLAANEVGAIIGIDAPNEITQIPSWYLPAEWERVVFSAPYYTLSLKKLDSVKLNNFDYTILTPIEQ
ncbi:MAG: hypothetical protein KDJ52_04735 [Anaerolineae bacterium]|nr:hypothetical protein [Anaerolineae bacterium]